MPDLHLKAVDAGYGTTQILRSVSLSIPKGQRVALVGSNGAGKSTLVKTINGLVPRWRGTVEWDGSDISQQKPHRRTQSGIATVPEGRMLFADCTVRENLLAGSTFALARDAREASLQRVFKLFPRLLERQDQRAGALSGGEQQMVAIGRALMTKPRLLILDEPSIGLAPRVVSEIFGVLSQLASEGVSLLLVEQNVKLSLQSVDYAYVLQQGAIVLEGRAQELLRDDRVRSAYLG